MESFPVMVQLGLFKNETSALWKSIWTVCSPLPPRGLD